MEETRTNKYKDYRNSILKEDATDYSSKDVLKGELKTTTLPLDEVIKTKKEEEKFDLSLFFRKYGKVFEIIAIVIGLCVIILGIILWALKVWRA